MTLHNIDVVAEERNIDNVSKASKILLKRRQIFLKFFCKWVCCHEYSCQTVQMWVKRVQIKIGSCRNILRGLMYCTEPKKCVYQVLGIVCVCAHINLQVQLLWNLVVRVLLSTQMHTVHLKRNWKWMESIFFSQIMSENSQ